MCLKAAATDDEDDDDYIVKLPFLHASTAAVSPLLSRLDNDVIGDDVNYAHTANNHDDGDSLKQVSYTDSYSKNEKSDVSPATPLPTVRDITTVQSASSLSSWQSVTAGDQQLNHAVVSEKRRLAAQKERLRKLRLVTIHFVV